jgi:hypothetical protein
MPQEQIERLWFVRFVSVLMVCCIAIGVVPILKNTFFPSAQTRR